MQEMTKEKLLEVKDLSVSFYTYAGEVKAVRGISFDLHQGEIVAIVGESGSGKSVTCQSIVGLLPSPPAHIGQGEIIYQGANITKLGFRKMRSYKGKEIAYIFQDPMTSLNPTMKVGSQIIEGIRAHSKVSHKQAMAQAIELLGEIGIPNPEKRVNQYPHEFSGGMRQRAMIAIAMSMNPRLLIADEPTTALDVTIQSQILNILKKINRSRGMSIILITHDMGIVANMAQRVLVMYGGKIVEAGPVVEIFHNSQHPYTRSLLAALPRIDEDTNRPLEQIVGSPPNMLNPPAGCPFAPRCRYSMQVCYSQLPVCHRASESHTVHCWLHDDRATTNKAKFIDDNGKIYSTEASNE